MKKKIELKTPIQWVWDSVEGSFRVAGTQIFIDPVCLGSWRAFTREYKMVNNYKKTIGIGRTPEKAALDLLKCIEGDMDQIRYDEKMNWNVYKKKNHVENEQNSARISVVG